ncbi:hypothetical protein HB662_05560 [Roseomonas frigidaquae]|uniref:Uncharacterized protein n=1 Tax=Falsiroseomonas frigidaquae TaxID=487318 RepID=A0ABX1EUB3_9PROT|nr:hypothetical protein [Falsiroseomonas frigidaquae]NKE44234.1 hypothetical protein [Falsiroseomonas frigidaquae]
MNVVNALEQLSERPPLAMAAEARTPVRGATSTFMLRKSGSRPVSFSGRHVGFGNGYRVGTPLWHELNLYQTEDGHFVADIRVFSKAQGAKDQFHVCVADSVEEALQFFEGYDARGDVQADFDPADPSLAPAELMVHAAALKYRIAEAESQYRAVLASFLHQLSAG